MIYIFNLYNNNSEFPEILCEESHDLAIVLNDATALSTILSIKQTISNLINQPVSSMRLIYLTNKIHSNSSATPLFELSTNSQTLAQNGVQDHAWFLLKDKKRLVIDTPVSADTAAGNDADFQDETYEEDVDEEHKDVNME